MIWSISDRFYFLSYVFTNLVETASQIKNLIKLLQRLIGMEPLVCDSGQSWEGFIQFVSLQEQILTINSESKEMILSLYTEYGQKVTCI